ncbi:MAG: hypothetical protein IPN79_14145 [Saprospiraceae bacterium]|nr:hypothetical protein [Saprospiraceae bacterium]
MMKNLLKLISVIVLSIFVQVHSNAQARLEIQNNSKRELTVKVMRSDGGNGELFTTVYISPNGSETVYFKETGNYFTKTKASLAKKKPICRKGDLFEVYNGSDGYSVLTLTLTIIESTVPKASGGKEISEKEFNEN